MVFLFKKKTYLLKLLINSKLFSFLFSDAFCSSPSTYTSQGSPESTNYRGIINPNYPGFQHLAHTLSEHFFDHQYEHSSEDSDLSEFESEAGHGDSHIKNENIIANNNRNLINNINHNNNNNNNNNNGNDNLDKIEDILKGAFQSRETILLPTNKQEDVTIMAEDIHSDIELNLNNVDDYHPVTMIGPNENDEGTNKEIADDDDLELYLNRYTSVDLKACLSPLDPILSTPDILIKSLSPDDTQAVHTPSANEKPDILQNVCVTGEECLEICLPVGNEAAAKADWIINNMTPVVDIVGNFEQEVEHEIGLIVSGYKSVAETLSEPEMETVDDREDAADIDSDNNAEKVEQSLEKVGYNLFYLCLKIEIFA